MTADGGPVDRDGDGAGVGPLAAVLLLVGAAAVIAGLTTLVPSWVLAAGVLVFVLGAALPLWSSWRRRIEWRDHGASADR